MMALATGQRAAEFATPPQGWSAPKHPLANSRLGVYKGHNTWKAPGGEWVTTFYYANGYVNLRIQANHRFDFETMERPVPRDDEEVTL